MSSSFIISPEQIRAARSFLHATREDLALATNISKAALNNIEQSLATPRDKTLDLIQKAFNRAGLYFFDDSETSAIFLKKYERSALGTSLETSTDILQRLKESSLFRLKKVLFFFVKKSTAIGEIPMIAIALESQYNKILFDQHVFDLFTPHTLSELSGILLACFVFYSKSLFYVPEICEETTHMETQAVLEILETKPHTPLKHFNDLLKITQKEDVFESYKKELNPYNLYHRLKKYNFAS